MLGVLAVLYLVFSPVLGPVLDHHFAERHHNHSHVYLGNEAYAHDHTYQLDHTHRYIVETGSTESRGGYRDGSRPAATVYLTSDDGVGGGLIAAAVPYLNQSLRFPVQGDNQFWFAWAADVAIPLGVLLSPPVPPPQS